MLPPCSTGRTPIPATTGRRRWRSRASRKPAGLRQGRGRHQGNQRQAAGPADHRGLDRSAEGPRLRRQRPVRRKPGVDGHEGSFDPDGRVQRHPEEQDAPLQHLQRRTDALHAAHHLVGRCDARRRIARLSGVARLHPHADGVCREDVELDQDGRARHRHAGPITPANFSHPLLVAQKVVPQPLIANDPATDAPAVKSDKGADAGQATKPANAEYCEFGGEPRSPTDRRPRAAARTDPHRGCQERIDGDQRRRDHVRCNAVRSQGSACQRCAECGSKAGHDAIRAGSQTAAPDIKSAETGTVAAERESRGARHAKSKSAKSKSDEERRGSHGSDYQVEEAKTSEPESRSQDC